MSKFKTIFFLGLIIYLLIALNLPILAAEEESPLWENTGDCRTTGNCSIRDLLQIFVNIAHLIYKYVAVTALAIWVWAGFGLVTARGKPEVISANKKLIVSTLFGLCIVLIAYLLVWTILQILTGQEKPTFGPGGEELLPLPKD